MAVRRAPAFADAGSADLVVASYTLGELPPAELTRLVHRLWQRATQAIVVVEPGTPRGFHTVSTVRAALIGRPTAGPLRAAAR
jgi:ribosomal protein RSM22 (predicted rRNA methylase)